MNTHASRSPEVVLLTGGGDRPYAFGLTHGLAAQGATLEVIVSDELDEPALRALPGVTLRNLRGSAQSNVSLARKVGRVLRYYARLIAYAATAKPRIFHILWNNRFEWLDRTAVMLYYRMLGKKVMLTLHNVNARRRDGNDSFMNRLTLRSQYRLANHIFLHTEKMKQELMEEFGVPESRITVIPFGINNSVANTDLTCEEARLRLGIRDREKSILFYGNIAPYKGLEHLATAFANIAARDSGYRLIIAGRPKNCDAYWAEIQELIRPYVSDGRIVLRAEFIPDDETEVYFKAADVAVLPYTHIYQSGVLFLAYSFGLPVLVSDVGSLKEDVDEGKTGFVFAPESSSSLVTGIERYFSSDLYNNLSERRAWIAEHAAKRNSWDAISNVILQTYSNALHPNRTAPSTDSKISFEMKSP